jgi:ABC-type lipoprotein release transport system permease subunit
LIAFKLAYRNLAGAGLRTWLNVVVLSLSYVFIIWHQGLMQGWDRMARRDMIDWEIGGGEYWHEKYDPYDPFSIQDGHGPLAPALASLAGMGEAVPILASQATLYHRGRMLTVLLKGIDPHQTILKIPSAKLLVEGNGIPAVIGSRMAESNGLRTGDLATLRWRDAHGTYDATDLRIVSVFKTHVPTVDVGQVWIPLERMRSMLVMPDEATTVVVAKDGKAVGNVPGWTWKGYDFLLADIQKLIRQKSIAGSVLYVVLMFLAMLAIFDTQVLSIFRRQREIGTHMAMGMTRGQVVGLFTVEGAMHAVLSALLAALYGIPLLGILAAKGWRLPQGTENYGLVVAERIFPVYGFGLVLGTVTLILITTTVVSYLPARTISRMNPTDAIRGKIQ